MTPRLPHRIGSLSALFLCVSALAPAAAHAGYGDVVDGYPSWAERDLHIWTNAVRVAPEEFSAEYEAGGCTFDSFEPGEKLVQNILYFDAGLCEASRFHCEDMESNDHFAHESSDGTSFFDRVSRWYTEGGVGENIAYGYGDGYVTVMQGWMCSAGHRENIMRGSFNELGGGVSGTYYTQDFGGGAPNWEQPMAMGSHSPGEATDGATFLADWQDAEAPASFVVVIDGNPNALALLHGAPEQGIYSADVTPASADCHEYYFAWTDSQGAEASFPEEGSYQYGKDCGDALWVDGHKGEVGGTPDGGDDGDGGTEPTADFPFAGSEGTEGESPKLVGCASAALGSSGVLALLGLAMVGRRRA